MKSLLALLLIAMVYATGFWWAIRTANARDCARMTQVLREDTNKVVPVCIDINGRVRREVSIRKGTGIQE